MSEMRPEPDSPSSPPPVVADPPPFEVVNDGAPARVLLICDHASRAIPAAYGNLGLDETMLYRHIAWDIGAAEVTRRLARLLDATAVLSGASRLLIDCNRPLDDPSSIPEVSDGIDVPGNRDVGAAERRRRIEAYFQPYHGEIARRLDALSAGGMTPAVVSIHSFTPIMNGCERPWHVGLLWDRDFRLTGRLLEALRRNPTLVVGDNEPYSGTDPRGYAIDIYGNRRGLPIGVFEIRQDLIDTQQGAESWAHLLADALRPALADPDLYRVERSLP